MSVVPAAGVDFSVSVAVLVIGAGACGLTAALAAHDAGAEVLVLERDTSPSGSTSMSSGFVPAPGTRWQKAKGIEDDPARFADDIQKKANGEADRQVVEAVATAIGPALEWLADAHGIPFELLEGFLYPGHSVLRMHAVPEHTGEALLARLLAAVSAAEIPVMTQARATTLYADADGRVRGVGVERPDGSIERIGCGRLILACNGYGGNSPMVAEHIPEMAGAEYHGHAGNTGDAVLWGEALGAAPRHLSACQGHGSLAVPHRILITWALMMEGGIQVNAEGRRFANEHRGYSEHAVQVLKQPGAVAWDIYDERLHRLGLTFPDYREAEAAGAIRRGATYIELAAVTGLPANSLAEAIAETTAVVTDRFGRDMSKTPALTPPFYAVKVTGALFHTQGGLAVDARARVLRAADGRPLPNLYAAGGAAVGVSGSRIEGYLSGNGLLTAVALGRIAGMDVARERD